MRIALNPGESITAVMSGAITTTAPAVSVELEDGQDTVRAALSGTTAVTLLTAPSNHKVVCSGISIYNADTTTSTVTINHVIDGTSYPLTKIALAAGETLVIGHAGINVLDGSGNTKLAFSSSTTTFTGDITLSDGKNLIFSGATGEPEIILTDNLADALSIKIASGNDLIACRTTNNDEAVIISQNLVVGTKATGAGSTFIPFVPMGPHTTSVAPAGAIPITNYYSTLDSTAGATTATLANGAVIGQVKKIQMIADNGDVVVTPANLAGGTTITFADVGDFAILIFDGTDWVAIELGNNADGVTAPVLA